MPASTQFARAYLRKAWADAQTASVALLAKLQSLNSAAVDAVGTGKTLSQSVGRGRSVTFTVNASEGVTPTEIVTLCERLLSLYDAAVASGASTDAARYQWMMDNLVPVRAFTTSFSGFSRY